MKGKHNSKLSFLIINTYWFIDSKLVFNEKVQLKGYSEIEEFVTKSSKQAWVHT